MAYFDGDSGDNTYPGTAAPDTIYGAGGNDDLYGGGSYDLIVGGDGADDIFGGPGRDSLWGAAADDWFIFGTTESGDITVGQADYIWDFQEVDSILLQGDYAFAGNIWNPADGQYGIWKLAYGQYGQYRNDAYVVTWNAPGDEGYHDVVVLGANPEGNIGFF